MEVKVGDYLTLVKPHSHSSKNRGAVCLVTALPVGWPYCHSRWEVHGVVTDEGLLRITDFETGAFRPSTDAEILKAKLFGL